VDLIDKKQSSQAPGTGELRSDSIVHDFKQSEEVTSMFTPKFLLILVFVAFLGVGTGYLLTTSKGSVGNSSTTGSMSSVPKGTIEGSEDTKTFKDTAEGVLAEGGKEGEGQFHLVRPGGESQYVYVTSSSVDLSKYVKRKVKIWGQTNTAQKVGWLMDVGRVEVLE